jgi:hypothetical protein
MASAKKVDEKDWEKWGAKMGKKMENKFKCRTFQCRFGGLFFPLLILAIGIYWLAIEMGWLTVELPFWPTVLIIIGAYWVISRIFRMIA